MASPGQRRGSCGHVMAGFDLHKKCARCRDKKVGDDPCVKGQDCELCDALSDSQKGMLATPQYQIRKDKKAGILISPSKVTVVGPVEEQDEIEMSPDAAHAQGRIVTGAFPVSDQTSTGDFVSRQDFELLNNQLEEKFARFEALLTRTNIFSTPKMPVSTSQAPISDTPFINPSPDPRATGPVRPPGQDVEDSASSSVKKQKGKSKHKKSIKPAAAAGSASQIARDPIPPKTVVPGPGLQVLGQPEETVPAITSVSSLGSASQPVITGPQYTSTSASFAPDSFAQPDPALSDGEPLPDRSDKESGEEGELSDTEVNEKNEEMIYRETVRSVRSFLGWSHIPDFEASASDTDNRSDNPWKGKHPRRSGKVSVELPADDWLCYKMEKLNTRVAEGYPSSFSVWLSLGSNPRVVSILREGYQLPFKERPPLARFPVIVSGSSNPSRNKNLSEALHSLGQKQTIEKVSVQSSLGFYNWLFLVPKPNGKWRPILDLSQLNLYLAPATFKMETPETIRLSLQQGEWVTSLDFSDAYFHIPINHRSRKYLRFHLKGQTFQFTALPFGLSTAPLEFTKVVKEVKLMAQSRGIRIHQYLDDWLLRAPCREICLRHTQTLLDLCRSLGWVVNMDNSELVPQQTFDFVGYHFDLSQGLVRPTQDRWRSLSQKLNLLLGLECCSVRQFMSLIGLLTATEKQVVSGRLHMRPIQWHLKKHWHTPESLEKVIPIPSSLHVHLRWWLDPAKVLSGQPLHPLQHALQLFTDASNEGWGAHLGNYMAKVVWLKSESALHINLLELKAVLLALKRFERLCCNQIVLVCTDNTTVVSYINKEGGMKSGSLCALLWRLMLWCNQRQIVLRARHIPGHLNIIADKLSRLNQVIQTEWSLLPEVFAQICRRWHRPSVDLFATRFNHKLPRFVSPVPDRSAWEVDALSLPWEDLDAFPPTALLHQVVTKLLDHGFCRLIRIAPGWPNMPWFWDLVNMSAQIPLLLPQVSNLITQPFNQCPHRDLPNLNLHAWLLEPLPSSKPGSRQKWQQESRLLKDALPEPFMNQSGPFLSDGVKRIRWTSELPL